MGSRIGGVLGVACAVLSFSIFPTAVLAQKAPDFTLNGLDGRAVRLSEAAAGRVTLINFWATWCVPCVKELPHLQSLQDRLADRGLRVLSVSTDGPDRLAAVSAFVGRYGFTMPVLLDSRSEAVALFDPRLVLPFTVILDRAGRVRFAHQGYSPGDERLFENEVLSLLEEAEARPKAKPAVRVNESLLLRLPSASSGDADREGYAEVLDQLELTASSGGLLAGVRVDGAVSLSPLEASVRLAKRYAQYSTKALRARAGDFHASLGRGLVFSLVKVFEEEGLDYVVDTTVDGGQVALGADPFNGEAFGGFVDRPEDRSVRDKVLGGALGWKIAGFGTVRVQAATAALEPGGAFGSRRADLGSVSLEVPGLRGLAEIYGEFSLIRRRTYDAEAPVNGHGLYVGSKLRAGRFSLLLEMKDYRELNFEYARPPLLEAEELDIVAGQFDLDRTDVTGFAARIDHYSPASATLLYAKGLLVDDSPEAHPQYGAYERRIGHVFGGVEKKFSGGGYLNALAGWRSESASSVAFLSTDGTTVHDQLNVNWPLAGRWSLEADWKHKVFDGDGYGYHEVRAGLSLHRSPRWVLSVLYERTTDPAVVFATGRKDFWAGQLELRLAGGHSLRLFAGATKGSMKCAGGVCRLFPPFEGVRLEAFLRF
ncbi:MAG TPA: TlpA disulfide reductase family protein [Candidatus Aminicenantes bacterium]|nr:TlpA disulfide reductase family protein [Candidatus Aminicenantes bacterium]